MIPGRIQDCSKAFQTSSRQPERDPGRDDLQRQRDFRKRPENRRKSAQSRCEWGHSLKKNNVNSTQVKLHFKM